MNETRFGFKDVVVEWWSEYRDSFFFVFVPMALGMIFVLAQDQLTIATAGLWAFACLAGGSLLGFLFGVPKVVIDTDGEGNGGRRRAGHPAHLPNTNLDNISDWLTKAIVGVGLVELREIPGVVLRAAEFAAGGVEATPMGRSTAAALIVLFVSLGFIGGYVNTRLYFAAAFKKVEDQQDEASEDGR